LFCVYIDGLLKRLACCKIGCNFGTVYVGALAYADDVVLLAPTASAMRRMLKICDDYAKEFNILFNAKKSKCMYLPPSKHRTLAPCMRPTFYVGGHSVEYVEQWSHLGHIISADHDDRHDIVNRRNTLCGQINNVLCYFGKCQPVVKQKLLFAYCYSLYGSVLWDLNNSHIESVCATWRKGLRRAWNLPADTHCALLYLLCNSLPVRDELAKRCIRFTQRCLVSDCQLVKFVANYGVQVGQMFSPIGRNAFFCCQRFGASTDDILHLSAADIIKYCQSEVTTESVTLSEVLFELLCIRDGCYSIDFEDNVVIDYIECICRQ